VSLVFKLILASLLAQVVDSRVDGAQHHNVRDVDVVVIIVVVSSSLFPSVGRRFLRPTSVPTSVASSSCRRRRRVLLPLCRVVSCVLRVALRRVPRRRRRRRLSSPSSSSLRPVLVAFSR
jgi:hypothetical protein